MQGFRCRVLLACLSVAILSCQPARRAENEAVSEEAFERIMGQLAHGWSTQNTDEALSVFAPDAIYMEPPEEQLFVGHDQLREYFGALKPGTVMTWHGLWFDEHRQVGAGEFTFGSAGADLATHGAVIVELRQGRIAVWREYLRSGPADRNRFLGTEDKKWRWTIENYP